MTLDKIFYRGGYKYQLVEDYRVLTGLRPKAFAKNNYISLDGDGTLNITEGYAWDGPSWPAIDTKNFMRGSLIHDALYQLLREGLLPGGLRAAVDCELRRACLQDGMSPLRAWWVFNGVRLGGGPSAKKQRPSFLQAP